MTAPRAKQKATSFSALQKVSDPKQEAIVFDAVARLFQAERKAKKARNWFERSVEKDPDYGDAWIHYLAFEKGAGDADDGGNRLVESIIQRCIDAAPRRGSDWTSVSKRVGNERLSTREILLLAAATTGH